MESARIILCFIFASVAALMPGTNLTGIAAMKMPQRNK